MSNRFNQIIDQQYVPLPFQEIMAASAIRQKTGDLNRAQLDDANAMLAKYNAIPESIDLEYKREAEKKANELIDSYMSPDKLYSPTTMYNFKKDLNRNIDFNRLKLGSDSYANYNKDLENQQILAKAGKLKQELIPTDWKGYDSRNGLYSGSTEGYSPSFDTTEGYIKDYAPHKDVDPVTGVQTEYVDYKDLENQAEYKAERYRGTTSFKHELAIAKANGDPRAEDPIAFSKEILIRDWSQKLKDYKMRGWAPKTGGKGSGDKEDVPGEITDWGWNRLTDPKAGVTVNDIAAIQGLEPMDYTYGNNTIKANQVRFDADNTINAYGTILRPQDAMQGQAFDGFKELDDIYTQVGKHVGGMDTETYANTDWGNGINNFNLFDKSKVGREPTAEDIQIRSELLKRSLAIKKKLQYSMNQITGKDYSKVNFINPVEREMAFKEILKASGLDKKFGSIEEARTGMASLGKAMDDINNGSSGAFVPSSGGTNKTYSADKDGNWQMHVNGSRYITKQELDLAFKNTDLGSSWLDELGPDGAKLIKQVSGSKLKGDEVFEVPTSIKIPMTDDAMDRINNTEYSSTQKEKYTEINHRQRQRYAEDRRQSTDAGNAFLEDLNKNDAEVNDFINTADEDVLRGIGYNKKRLKDEYQKAIGSGDPYTIGETIRKMVNMKVDNRYMDALGNAEGNQNVQNKKGSSALGTHQVLYSEHKDLFKKYGIDAPVKGEDYSQVLKKIEENPGRYKAMVSELLAQTKKEAAQVAQKFGNSYYDNDDMVALTWLLGQGDLTKFMTYMEQNNNNEVTAWSMMPKKITSVNSTPSEYLRRFKDKLNKT